MYERSLTKIEGASTYYYHNDHLATPQKMTDASGVVVWSADYKPFGEATVSPSLTITNNIRFPGQYYDQETGLHYNYFRDYSTAVGTYIEVDPIGDDYGKNHLYNYARNNPLRYDDKNGLYVGGVGIGGSGAIGGGALLGLTCSGIKMDVQDGSGNSGKLTCWSCGVSTQGLGKKNPIKGLGGAVYPLMALNCPKMNSVCDLAGSTPSIGLSGGVGLAASIGYSGGCMLNGAGLGFGGLSASFEPGSCSFEPNPGTKCNGCKL